MSKLEELIQQYCPDGVEFKLLGEVCDIHKGVQFNKSDMQDEGTYPVINGGINPSGYVEVFNEEENTITISQGGASAGYVNFLLSKFWLGAHCYAVKPTNEVKNRYLYHFIKQNEITLQQCQYGAGIPALAKGTITSLEIPIPPLPVQEEIVRVLDTFTELQAELQAELQKRLQQYNYYRDNLLSFDGRTDVEWKKLGDVMTIQRGASPRPIQNFLTDDENGVPWIKIGDVSPQSKYISSTKERVTKEGVSKSRYLKKGSFILSNSMSFGRPYILEIDGCIHDGWISMCDFQKDLNPDFLYHVLRSNTVQSYWISKANSGGAVANLNSDIVRDTLIPIPSFEEQQKVVDVLDKFNALTTDLTSGLPAEIEKRRQQYEFYRDKLLTFKRK